jgi:hypothetical protein
MTICNFSKTHGTSNRISSQAQKLIACAMGFEKGSGFKPGSAIAFSAIKHELKY